MNYQIRDRIGPGFHFLVHSFLKIVHIFALLQNKVRAVSFQNLLVRENSFNDEK